MIKCFLLVHPAILCVLGWGPRGLHLELGVLLVVQLNQLQRGEPSDRKYRHRRPQATQRMPGCSSVHRGTAPCVSAALPDESAPGGSRASCETTRTSEGASIYLPSPSLQLKTPSCCGGTVRPSRPPQMGAEGAVSSVQALSRRRQRLAHTAPRLAPSPAAPGPAHLP